MTQETTENSTDNNEPTLYERLGGEPAVRQLVDTFYNYMFTLEEVKELKDLHQGDLDEIKEKLFKYFTGWFGGPPLFINEYGHPRLRARHIHVPIGALERDQWLKCMTLTLTDLTLEPELYKDLMEKIAPMADHMRNKQGDGDTSVNCKS